MSFCCDFLALMNQVAVHMHIVALLPASMFAIPMSHLSGILIAVTMDGDPRCSDVQGMQPP